LVGVSRRVECLLRVFGIDRLLARLVYVAADSERLSDRPSIISFPVVVASDRWRLFAAVARPLQPALSADNFRELLFFVATVFEHGFVELMNCSTESIVGTVTLASSLTFCHHWRVEHSLVELITTPYSHCNVSSVDSASMTD